MAALDLCFSRAIPFMRVILFSLVHFFPLQVRCVLIMHFVFSKICFPLQSKQKPVVYLFVHSFYNMLEFLSMPPLFSSQLEMLHFNQFFPNPGRFFFSISLRGLCAAAYEAFFCIFQSPETGVQVVANRIFL